MSKNDSIANMKNRAQVHKQRQANDDQQPVTVATTYRKPSSDLTAQGNGRLTPQFRNQLNACYSLNGTTLQGLVPFVPEEHMKNNPVVREDGAAAMTPAGPRIELAYEDVATLDHALHQHAEP